MTILWIILANLVIGALIGLTGVAGFLLPMLYVSLGYGVQEALALSFFAFFLSGTLGSYNYHRSRQLNLANGMRLGIPSLFGAILGVWLNTRIAEGTVQILLYLVVLLSGISILLRKDRDRGTSTFPTLPVTILLGFASAVICALSGAGGPVLVMPLLVVLGVSVREAIALALFDSIFIAIPSGIGYLLACDARALLPILALSGLAHAIGVYVASCYSNMVPQPNHTTTLAHPSILLALYKLFF